MKVSSLASPLKVASMFAHSKSPATLYRSIEFVGDIARTCSEVGEITMALDEDTELSQPCLINVERLKAVLQTLNPSEDIRFAKSSACLDWETEFADGSIELEPKEHEYPDLIHTDFPWLPPPSFRQALLLAETAVSAATVSRGLYGVEIVPSGEVLRIGSTNSASIAIASIQKGDYPSEQTITIRPPVPKILAYLLQHSDCCMDVTGDGLFIRGDWFTSRLSLAPALEGNLFAFADQYEGSASCR